MEKTRPGVGVGVLITRNKRILLGKRKNSHGEGTWAPPGGHLEWYESVSSCAKREVKEETGLDIVVLTPNSVATTNDFFPEDGKHYVTLFVKGYNHLQEPKVMEPDKCEEWKWYDWREIPKLNLFVAMRNLIKQNYDPFQR